jgi:hypothetical protein
MTSVMFHDDDCGEWIDSYGRCPRCRIYPDMQSLGITGAPQSVVNALLADGRTLLGPGRRPITTPHKCEESDGK